MMRKIAAGKIFKTFIWCSHNFLCVRLLTVLTFILKINLPVGLVADAVTNHLCCVAHDDKGIGIDTGNQSLQTR